MICGLPPLSTSKNEELLVFEEDKVMSCGNLSSTMQKLYNWENKLLEEVMVSKIIDPVELNCDLILTFLLS